MGAENNPIATMARRCLSPIFVLTAPTIVQPLAEELSDKGSLGQLDEVMADLT